MALKRLMPGGFVCVPTSGVIGKAFTDDAFAHSTLTGIITGASAGGTGVYSLVITPAQPDAGYTVAVEAGTTSLWTIDSKSTGGFTLNFFGLDGNPLSILGQTVSVIR